MSTAPGKRLFSTSAFRAFRVFSRRWEENPASSGRLAMGSGWENAAALRTMPANNGVTWSLDRSIGPVYRLCLSPSNAIDLSEFSMLDGFFRWLVNSPWSNALNSAEWVFPAVQSLHFIGFAMS